MRSLIITVALAAVLGVGVVVAFDPSSCGHCPSGFSLHTTGSDLSLGGGAFACPWICKCNGACFSCSDGTDSNVQVVALFKGKDNNLVSSSLDNAQSAMSDWIATRMSDMTAAMGSCVSEERSKESLLGDGSKTDSKFLGFNLGPCSPVICARYIPDEALGATKVAQWHTSNLGTSDIWSGTYKTLLETELAGDELVDSAGTAYSVTWTVEMVGSNPQYLKIKREGKGPCQGNGISTSGNTCIRGVGASGDLYYYAYLSKYTGAITTNSGDLVLTKITSIAHKPHACCSEHESSAASVVNQNVIAYLDAGEPVLKKALNKVRFQVVKDMTSRL